MGGSMKRIAVFFPGIGYHCDKPLLYYSRQLAREAGYQEIVSVSYAYQAENLRGNPEKMREPMPSPLQVWETIRSTKTERNCRGTMR